MRGVFPARPDLRVSDAEREAVAEFLTRHYVEGRLTDAELTERVSAAYDARRESQLGALIRDLPPIQTPRPPARRLRLRLRGLRSATVLAVAFVAAMLLLEALPAELSILFVMLTAPMLIALSVILVPAALIMLAFSRMARALGRPQAPRLHRTVS